MNDAITFGRFPAFPGDKWTTRWDVELEAGNPRRDSRPLTVSQQVTYEVVNREPDELLVTCEHAGAEKTFLVRDLENIETLDKKAASPADAMVVVRLLEPFRHRALRWLSGRTLRIGERAHGVELSRRDYFHGCSVDKLVVTLTGGVLVNDEWLPVLLEEASYRKTNASGDLVSVSYECERILHPETGLLRRENKTLVAFGLGPGTAPSSLGTHYAHRLTLAHEVLVLRR